MSLTLVEIGIFLGGVVAVVVLLAFIFESVHSAGVREGRLGSKVDNLASSHDKLASSVDNLTNSHNTLASSVDNLTNSHNTLASSVDNLTNSHNTLASSHETLTKSFNDFRASFKDEVKEAVADGVKEVFADFGASFKDEVRETIANQIAQTNGLKNSLQGSSPKRLTTLGKKVSKDAGAKDIVRMIAPALVERARGLSNYKIQELSDEYMIGEFKPAGEVERKMEESAYNNGVGKLVVKLVIAVELRDVLLKSSKSREMA